jgi:ElaB/YqjD/DUF883 family membrane-anchored ribosome-binding protein
MSDTTLSPSPEDLDETFDAPSATLDRQADDLLRAGREPEVRRVESVRAAAREDLQASRAWARARADRVQGAIQEEPLRATLYALGLGVLIGLLLRR